MSLEGIVLKFLCFCYFIVDESRRIYLSIVCIYSLSLCFCLILNTMVHVDVELGHFFYFSLNNPQFMINR